MSYFKNSLSESLENPEFKKEWESYEVEHRVARSIIKKRIDLGLSQMDVAILLHTTENVVTCIENAEHNLTLVMLKDIAKLLGMDLQSLMFHVTD